MLKVSPEVIEVIGTNNVSSEWEPFIGPETQNLLDYLKIDEESKNTLLNEAVKILSKCIPPTSVNATKTGLVVGYVQSGKTMSFTTVATLARDNCYPLIIVIAGTSIPLFEQSVSRLRRDLRLDTRQDIRWQLFINPKPNDSSVVSIKNTLKDWSDEAIPYDQRQTVLIAVMKNHTHLKNLISVFNGLGLNGSKVSTLIIDDEADQASLNTLVQKREESTTFKCIVGIRQSIPNNTFLQYTATPQAPLLINIINILSPDFAEVLTPGITYIGGKDFFIGDSPLIEKIHLNELQINEEPPESLKMAMAIFFIGIVAKHIVPNSGRNRSMMVHPSIKRIRHNQFYVWVISIKENWERILQLPNGDQDKIDLINYFSIAYDNLHKTVLNLPPFEEILENLSWNIRKTVVEEVNSTRGRTPTIDWSTSPSYILVGGQAMDRGFTVEGLTVTYMPRGIGVGNADTVQQRARFFGYKGDYIRFCRIFIDQDTLQAYKDYVEHEEDIRRQLVEHGDTGKSLSEWKRVFLMPRQLRPTRNNVIDIDYTQDDFDNIWFYPRSPHISKSAVVLNNNLIDDFVSTLKLSPDKGHPDRSPVMRHLVNNSISLKDIYERLISQFKVSDPEDSQKFIGLQLQVRNYLERHPEDTSSVYIMSCNSWKDGWLLRDRGVDDNDNIKNIFQGAHPDASKENLKQGEIYPADNNLGDKNRLIVQIHRLNLTNRENVIARDIYDLAIWIPGKMANSWLSQQQNKLRTND